MGLRKWYWFHRQHHKLKSWWNNFNVREHCCLISLYRQCIQTWKKPFPIFQQHSKAESKTKQREKPKVKSNEIRKNPKKKDYNQDFISRTSLEYSLYDMAILSSWC